MCMAFCGFVSLRSRPTRCQTGCAWMVSAQYFVQCLRKLCLCSTLLAERFPNPFEAELEELKDRYAQMQVGH